MSAQKFLLSAHKFAPTDALMPKETTAEIHERVAFELALKRVVDGHLETLDFKNVYVGRRPEWAAQLAAAVGANATCTTLDLSGAGVTDAVLQALVAALATGGCAKLRRLELGGNPLTLSAETMAQGLRLLRPQLEVALGDGMDASRQGGFVHQKLLVEGLTAWPAHALQAPSGGSDLLCPPEIAGDGVQIVMTKGFSGTNGTKYVCDLAEFEVLHGTGNLVLKRLEPEARLRLAARLSEPEGVVV